ncbi:MAG: diguanylate cyclase [Pseudomonadota bacterium]|nr:diguanylate cyclase [Pseudomonadota bacterium]
MLKGIRRTGLAAKLAACCYALALILVLPPLHAQPSAQTARFRSLTDVDGLSQMSAMAMVQDREGFLWVGTQVGLNRYDGTKMRVFIRERDHPRSISEHYVSSLLSAADGSLWIGTLNGLNRFDPASEQFETFLPLAGDASSLAQQKINTLLFDADGVLWIGSDGGLSRYQAARRNFDNFGADLADPRVLALAPDGSGGFWVGTAAGLLRFDVTQQRFSPVLVAAPTSASLRDSIQALRLDRSGELWIGTKNSGLLRLSPRSGALVQWRHDPANARSISHNRVYALLEDRSGLLWIGTEAGADLMLDRSGAQPHFDRFKHQPQLTSSIGSGRVVSLIQDKAGDLWFGTWSGGASLLSAVRSRFLSFEANSVDPHALDAAEIVNMTNAGPEQIWLGTRRGLFLFDATTYRLKAIPATSGMLVYAVARYGAELLLGTDQGIFRYDPATQSVQRAVVSVEVGRPFVDFIVVEPDRIWVSTRDADLFVLDRTLGSLLAHHVLATRAHFTETFDATTRLFGTDKGLYWFSSDGLIVKQRLRADPQDADALQSDTCHGFLRASDGAAWLATGAGLHRMFLSDSVNLTGARFELFPRSGGASSNAIKSVIEDRNGRLWMSSNAGIARFDPGTSQFTSYGEADGAIDRGYYAFVHTTTAAGQIAFGGASGFTVFDPEKVSGLPPPPLPLLTEIELDDHALQLSSLDARSPLINALHRTTQLTIPAGQARSLSLAFAAPYFAAPEQLRFAYRMDGFNPDWINAEAKRRVATYTNLAPGDYRFRLRARTADAPWGTAETQLAITIQPFWWQTTWARLLGIAALIAAVAGLFYARLHLLAQRQKLLAEQVAERTADILKLGEVGQELTATLNFEQAADRVYRQVRARLDAHVFLIAIYREASQLIELEYLIEGDVRRANLEYSMSEQGRPAVWCVRECRELVTATNQQLADYVKHPLPAKQGQTMESVVYLPLRIEQRVIGCLSVQSPRPHAYSSAHLEFLRALASYTAIALDNADNYRRLDQAAAQTREAMASMHSAHLALEAAYGRIEQLSQTDTLTGLGNRRSLERRLPQLLGTAQGGHRLAFLLIDIDRFKSINDEHGHASGDQALSSMGELLRTHFDDQDIVVRWGGEEFLVVAAAADETDALRIAERLRKDIADNSVKIDGGKILGCTASIGFACYPFDPKLPQRLDWERVIEIADSALYAAKRAGRNLVFGFRCTGILGADFEARLRRGPDELCKAGVLEQLFVRAAR